MQRLTVDSRDVAASLKVRRVPALRGTNIDAVAADVRKAVEEQVLPWLTQYRDLEVALQACACRISGRKPSEDSR